MSSYLNFSCDLTVFLDDNQITSSIDPTFGVFVLKWDFSVKVFYSIDIIGGELIKYSYTEEGDKILNQGSDRWCDIESNFDTEYCEFENYFRQDISKCLDINYENVHVIFIIASGQDSVLVKFRFIPPALSVDEHYYHWIQSKVLVLIEQVRRAMT